MCESGVDIDFVFVFRLRNKKTKSAQRWENLFCSVTYIQLHWLFASFSKTDVMLHTLHSMMVNSSVSFICTQCMDFWGKGWGGSLRKKGGGGAAESSLVVCWAHCPA